MLAITMTFFPFLSRSTPARGIDWHLHAGLERQRPVDICGQGWMHDFDLAIIFQVNGGLE